MAEAAAALPAVAIFLAVLALRPRAEVVAPIRLAIVRGALAVGAVAVAGVELLSTMDRLDGLSFVVFWLVVSAFFAVPAAKRARFARPRLPSLTRPSLTRPELAVVLGLAGLVLAELVLAVASAPNNYDSNYYHLSKVEHWVANHNVGVYATVQLQQVAFAPGGEYLLLHLRLLTGGDSAYNLVQWGAGIGAALAVSRIVAQFGGGRLAQLLGAAAFLTAPMVALESTSTQTDLVVTAWVMCAATIAVDGLRRRSSPADVAALGAAAGLTAATKTTGLMGLAAVLLLWGVAQLRLGWTSPVDGATSGKLPPQAAPEGTTSGKLRRRRLRHFGETAGASVAIVAIGLLVFGPFMVRMQHTFGSPLGPPEYNRGLSMQRHDPPALLVNALRIAASTMVVPAPPVNAAVARAVIDVSDALRVNPQDPRITLSSGTYPNPRWQPDEDHAPYPLQSALVLAALAAALLLRRVPGPVRAYAAAVLLAMLLTVATVKWQVWGNRLLLSGLALGSPLVGWWSARIRWRWVVAGLLAVSLVGAYGSVAFGQPRRLLGHNSVFTLNEWQQRFARQPARLASYETATGLVRASGAKRVGIVLRGDQWEYPLWLMLPGRELKAMESLVPGEPPTQPTEVDAIICVSQDWLCKLIVPKTWRYVQIDSLVAVGLPPS